MVVYYSHYIPIHVHNCTHRYIYIYINIYIGSRLGVPWAYTINVVMVEMGGGGCNNVMWSAFELRVVETLRMLLRWRCCYVASIVVVYRRGGGGGGEGGVGGVWWGVITSCGARWIESCGNLEDVASLGMLLRCKYRCCLQKRGGGAGWGVTTACGARWIESCGNLEDVASLRMLWRCRKPMVLSLQATASKNLCGCEDEKGVMFISSMVLQWIITFSSYQQNDQKCMKLQFQWLEC